MYRSPKNAGTVSPLGPVVSIVVALDPVNVTGEMLPVTPELAKNCPDSFNFQRKFVNVVIGITNEPVKDDVEFPLLPAETIT
jgi:hypothetical protein